MNKSRMKLLLFNFLGRYNPKIKTKFTNICDKTGQYKVPDELYQRRTSRRNRVLISWKSVSNNKLTLQQLATFSGGVTVEFINEDFFEPKNQKDQLFKELISRIGSDDVVSAMISIRSETGSTSSFTQRENFNKLIQNTEVFYKGEKIVITKNNYMDYAIRQVKQGGKGNEKWDGFLFISIKGGQHNSIQSHSGNMTIFNPACEFANYEVVQDLNLVMSYFALHSVNKYELSIPEQIHYDYLLKNISLLLKNSFYESESSYTGNLLDYCNNHPSVKMMSGKLYDSIQVEPINIEDFGVDIKEDKRKIDFTHDEAVNLEKYYWDSKQNCILSAARPTNVFWSKHISNMMQQNFTLNEYFLHEEAIVKRRKELLDASL